MRSMPKAKRVVFEVRWDKSTDGWRVYRDNVFIVASSKKANAVSEAVRLMKLEERSELKVKNKKGRISERRTWPRSSDPKGRG